MIKTSCKDHLNKPSSTRINGYWMTVLLTIIILCGVGMEISCAINSTECHSISNSMIALATLVLGQQALLFHLKRKSEDTAFPTVEKLNNIVNTDKNSIPNVLPDEEVDNANAEQQESIINNNEDLNMGDIPDAGTNGVV
jgi:hypothetical protein